MIAYEWCCETVTTIDTPDTERGEVVDTDHAGTLAELLERMATSGPGIGCAYVVCLHRQWFDSDANSEPATYAYIRDGGILDSRFADAYGKPQSAVPQRFIDTAGKHRETLAKYAAITVES